MLKALSQAPKGDLGPEPTSELPAQLPGLMVPLGSESVKVHCTHYSELRAWGVSQQGSGVSGNKQVWV